MNVPIYPDDPSFSRRFHLVSENSSSRARIGGNMPEGLSIFLDENAEYIGTFPLYEGESQLYFSLFINCPIKEFILEWDGKIKNKSNTKLLATLHDYRPRSKSARYASSLQSQHSIHILDVAEDVVQNDMGEYVVQEGHKFGGSPYCIQEPRLAGWEELRESDYRQVLQMDFPGLDDGPVSGPWPFGDGLFNLFWKYPFEGEDYFWCVQS